MRALIASALCCVLTAAPVMASEEDWAPLSNPELDLSIWVPPTALPNDGIMVPILVLGALGAAGAFVIRLYTKAKHANDTTIPCRIDVYELDGLTDQPSLYMSMQLMSGPAFTNYWDAVSIPMKDRGLYKVVITPLTNSIP